MKFVCSNCKAKYQIADEKAAGRTLRMTCRRCNNEIVIQGSPAPGGTGTGARRDPRLERTAAPPPPAAASPLAADFRRQVAGGGSDLTSSLVSDEWHVAINDIPVGPMRRDEVARKISIGAVTPESLAWREGLDDWMPAADIPELAMLFGAQLQAPPPPAEVRPAARARVVPVGGRVGVEASPAVIEDIVIPEAPQPERLSSSGSVSAHATQPPPSEGQNAGRLFLMVSAGVFVMFVGVVIGVKVLTPAPQPQVVQAAPTEPAASAATPAVEQETEEDNVIALDMQEIDGEAAAARAKAKTGADTSKKAPTVGANGRPLTAAEQAMLAQMSGGGSTASIKAPRASATGEQRAGGGEGLNASQLSSVVNKKRSELQRCYESALRATASDETVRLDVDITIGTSGAVTKIGTRGKALPGMDTCIERTVRMWRFPTASGETRTSFPVVFQPGG